MIITEFTPEPAYPHVILGPDTDTGERSRDHRVHLTTVLRDMATTAGISKQSDFTEMDLAWFAAGGWLWERIFDKAHQEAIDRGDLVNPGEFEVDGIVGTPDRVDLSVPKLIELKVRWKSANKFDALETNFWIELAQVAAYCHMLKIYQADLIVFFIAGDWRPPTPKVRAVHIEFTEFELMERWRTIRGHAKMRGWL